MQMNNQMPIQAENREAVIDLSYYWSVVFRHKWNIAAFVFVVALITFLFTFSMDKVFRSSATLLIESEEARVVGIEGVYSSGRRRGEDYFLTQFEILKSRELAERVVENMELVTHPQFDPRQQEEGFSLRKMLFPTDDEEVLPPSEEAIFQSVVDRVRGSTSISPVRKTHLVRVSYESSNPEVAAALANAFAQAYIESHLDSKMGVTVEAAGYLRERLEGLRQTLRESEQKLQEYRESEGLIDVQGVQTLKADELEELTRRYADASQKRSEAETLYLQVKALGDNPSYEELVSIPSVLRNPLVQNLREDQSLANRKVVELSKRYGPKHPKMIAAKSDAAQTLSELEYQARRVAQGIETDYRGAQQTERTIESQISGAKSRAQGVNRKEFRLRELEREVEANRELYDMFLVRAKETTEAQGLSSANARIVDRAIQPKHPIKPQKKRILMIAVVLSGSVGVMLAFLLEALNNTLRRPEDVEEKLGVPLLGYLPLESKNKSKLPFEGFKLEEKGGFSEAIRTVRTSLMLQNIDKANKITLVTSSVPSEGKSTVSLNLARVLGQVERVLLIDADMRRPTMTRVIDLPKGAAGLAELTAGTAELANVVFRMDDHKVDVIPSGVIPSNPLELLESKRFERVLDKLSEHYDRIIIDCAPIHAVSDALVLSKKADEMVYVIKADSTDFGLIEKGLRRLEEIKAPLVGVILNQVNVVKAGRDGGYYTAYYENYGYSSEEEFNAQTAYQKVRDDEHNYQQAKPLKAIDS